jgi:ATP-dependent Clp protease ATP-binding subunit ClpA
MNMMVEKKIEIFCCYAREDQELLLKFKKHLKPMERLGFITVWSDIDISAGIDWENEIKKHLDSAHIILLFVSPDFIQSDYCYSTEMSRAMERHEHGEARVMPIILRPVRWYGTPFGKLQVLPSNVEPVTSRIWHTLDDAFFDVVTGIEKGIKDLLAQSISLAGPMNATSKVTLKANTATGKALRETKQQSEQEVKKSDEERFDKFTQRVRNVLYLAHEEAARFQHNYIGTEHLLLGLVADGESVVTNKLPVGLAINKEDIAIKVLANLGVELNIIRRDVEYLLGPGDRVVQSKIGLTPRAKKIIELAVDESLRLRLNYIGTGSLLLGMLCEGEGIAWGVLENLGVNLEKARAQIIQILNQYESLWE